MHRSLFAKLASANRRACSKILLVSLGRSNFISAHTPIRRLAARWATYGAACPPDRPPNERSPAKEQSPAALNDRLGYPGGPACGLGCLPRGTRDNKARLAEAVASAQEKSMRLHLALASLIIIAISLGGLFAAAIWERHEQEALGQLHFPISCSASSQRLFDFATSRLHSLSFNEAERAYIAIAEAEPDCAIAYWGISRNRLVGPVTGP